MVSAVSYNKKLWRVLRRRSLLEADNVLVFLFWPTYLFWLVVSGEGVNISDWWRLWCSLCCLINLLWPFEVHSDHLNVALPEVTEVILYLARDKSTWLCVFVCKCVLSSLISRSHHLGVLWCHCLNLIFNGDLLLDFYTTFTICN